jgi:LacI family transcriptional regulator, galactose operon repressor
VTDGARVTLVDVAHAAGVSPSTASRVLNGGAPVTPGATQRVTRAAEELGYRLNTQARSLRTGRDNTIGLVVEDFNVELFARIASTVSSLAAEQGVHVVIATFGTGGSEPHAVEALASRSVAGMVVVEGQAGTEYLESIGRARPVVLVDAARPHPTIDTVLVDNHGGGRQATERLIEHGHSRIAFVGSSPRAKTVLRRYEGYAEALTAAGLPVRPELVTWAGLGTVDALPVLRDRVRSWDGVTAAFTAVARTTPGLYTALAEHGRLDVEVMAFDDMELGDVVVPPMSAIAQDAAAIARSATGLLFDRIAGFTGPARHVEVPLSLVDRSTSRSGAPAPAPPDTAVAPARL